MGLGRELIAVDGAVSVCKAVEVRPSGGASCEAMSVVDVEAGKASAVVGTAAPTKPSVNDAAVDAKLVVTKEAGDGDKAAPDDDRD